MFRHRPLAAALTLALVAPVTALATSPVASAAPTPSAGRAAPTPSVKHLPRPVRDQGSTRAHDPHTVLVKFTPSASASKRDKAVQSRGGRLTTAVGGTGFVTVRTTGAADELASRLSTDPSVAEVTLDYIRESSASPNDYFNATTHEQEYLKTVRIPTAWDRSKGSLSQVVAVLDSGVNGKHPDLTGRTVAGFNAITDVGIAAGAASDDFGHGSMVAGIIAAETNNSEGISGVAWNARVMPVKVLNSAGKGTDSDIVQGIRWAADHGARIINMSLGGPGDSPALHDAVKYAVAKGAVVVAAAGNTGGDRPEYPAAYPEAIAVAATDTKGSLTYFSTHGSWVDVAAPGWDILSTERGSDYYIGAGTSFSAPIVAGIAVLLRSKTPSMTPAQIAARLRTTARDAGPRGIDPFYGAGIVDATNALGGGWAGDFAQPTSTTGEPNDVPARSTLLDGSTMQALGTEGDVDWHRYVSPGQQQVLLTVTPPTVDPNNLQPQSIDPMLAVYDENLKLVAQVDTYGDGQPESLGVRMAAGTYYVSVSNYNGSRVGNILYTLSAQPQQGGGLLADATHLPSDGSYGPIATGDLDGDGRDDVVAGTMYGSGPVVVHVFSQQPTGGLGAPVVLETADASVPRNFVVTDFDGDGSRDIVTATQVGIQVFRQTATHTFAAPEVVPDTVDAVQVAVADVTGDGRRDLVVSTMTEIVLLTGQADGTFTRTVLDSSPSLQLEVTDIDGDGRVDITTNAFDAVHVLRNTTAGWVTTSLANPMVDRIEAMEVAELNGDSRLDIAAVGGGNAPDAKLVVWRGAAGGTFGPPTQSATVDLPQTIEAADVNGDGRQDLVIGHGGMATVSVMQQRADGTIAGPSPSATTTGAHYDPNGLAVTDLTGDGKLDAVVAAYTGLDVLRNGAGATPGTTQLWVRSTTPNDFGSGMTQTYTPTVTFARDVVPSSVTSSTVRILNGRNGSAVPATVTYDAVKRTATVRPSSPLYDNAPYRLTVSGVKDTSSATMTTAYSSTFRTVDVAPKGVGTFRAAGALRAATLTWTAPGVNDLDRYVIRMTAGSTPPSSPTTGTAVYSGTALSAKVNLAQGTTYTFRIWAKDRSGRYSAASSARLVGTAETITSTVTSLTKGRTVTVSSRLTRRDTGSAVAGVPVQLYWRRVGSTTWNLTATRTSSSTGAVSFTHAPTASVDYMWIYRGSGTFVGSSSALRRVTVR
ncbi:S8 family serine peptidase [Terrabacter sp. 2TAF16]|uniref:S8 family serine peptidase n=1 Tax=Terrabacter sp. 2TAF16 TaxID=3233008 RepID=UPI003F964B23